MRGPRPGEPAPQGSQHGAGQSQKETKSQRRWGVPRTRCLMGDFSIHEPLTVLFLLKPVRVMLTIHRPLSYTPAHWGASTGPQTLHDVVKLLLPVATCPSIKTLSSVQTGQGSPHQILTLSFKDLEHLARPDTLSPGLGSMCPGHGAHLGHTQWAWTGGDSTPGSRPLRTGISLC